jgi:phage N-6-adenine-methyltransferase
MGAIDLDPASSDTANKHVRASRYYTAQQNGLAQDWFGRVWLNPPYAMPYIKQFVNRMCGAWQTGEISEGVLLTNSATDTAWFDAAYNAAEVTCFTRGRIRFLEARNGELRERPAPMMGQVFFYFGVRTAKFAAVFGEFGNIARH